MNSHAMFEALESRLLLSAMDPTGATTAASLASATLIQSTLVANYVVDASAGSDANSGSAAAPFRSISRAISFAQAGHTVLVKAGTYREALNFTRPGTAAAPITFVAETPGSVIVDGADASGVVVRRQLAGGTAPYITIKGFVFHRAANFLQTGAVVTNSGWRLEDVTVQQADANGIIVRGDKVTLLRVIAQDNGAEGLCGSQASNVLVLNSITRRNNTGKANPAWKTQTYIGEYQAAIRANNGLWYVHPDFSSGGGKWWRCNNVTIDGLQGYGNVGPGIWFDDNSTNVVIRNGRFYDNRGLTGNYQGMGIEIELQSTGPFTIQNNVISGNTGPGITLSSARNVVVKDNTLIGDNLSLLDYWRGADHTIYRLYIAGNKFNNAYVDTWGGTWTPQSRLQKIITIDYDTYDNGTGPLMRWGDATYSSLPAIRSQLGFELNGIHGNVGANLTAPANLQATALSNSHIRLDWTDTSISEAGFKIESSRDGGASWTQAVIVGANVRSHTFGGLPASAQFLFRIRAFVGTDHSAYSGTAAATTYALAAPSALTAAQSAPTEVTLNWSDNSAAESGFRIEHSSDGGITWSQTATVPANTRSYSAGGLTSGVAHRFRVRGYTATGGYSPYSNVAAVTLVAPPAAPDGLSTLYLSANHVTLTWSDRASNESGFKIERSLDGVNWVQIAAVGMNVPSYAATGLAPNTTYHFRVRAYNAAGHSPYSNTLTATTVGLAAPANLLAASLSPSQIRLTWQDVTSSESGFHIQRSTDGTSWAQIGTVAANTTTYTAAGLSAGTTYRFRVRAYTSTLVSPFSNVATAVTATDQLPAAPAGLWAPAVGPTRAFILWSDRSSNESGFKIERSLDGVNWVQIGVVGANTLAYAASELSANTTYYFRVRAYNVAGDSAYSNILMLKTPPA